MSGPALDLDRLLKLRLLVARFGEMDLARSCRCAEGFEPPVSVTLWRLPETIEEEFDARWEHWLDNASDRAALFAKLESLPGAELTAVLRSFEVVSDRDLKACARLRRWAEGGAMPPPGMFAGKIRAHEPPRSSDLAQSVPADHTQKENA